MNKTVISALTFLMLLVSVSAQVDHYYKVELSYVNGNFSINSIIVQPSPTKLIMPEGRHIAEVVSINETILNLVFFRVPTMVLVDSFNPEIGEISSGGIIKLNKSEITLYIPYNESAKEINIYDPDLNKELTVNVESFAKVAVIAEEIKEQKIDPVIEETVATEEPKRNELLKKIFALTSVLLLVIALLIFIIIMIARKKRTFR